MDFNENNQEYFQNSNLNSNLNSTEDPPLYDLVQTNDLLSLNGFSPIQSDFDPKSEIHSILVFKKLVEILKQFQKNKIIKENKEKEILQLNLTISQQQQQILLQQRRKKTTRSYPKTIRRKNSNSL
ncbi:hypothetical protein M0811_10056 [Anaeramoeba ignava]|uniref:Uncharacterized protein n=1 Tax=Anaeramoeba ignava TaxID=1746090 RepID=A0A9Q0LF17_ANAIG|nr:hypothetical protein M0811_10056 [Anaeramoeba ignava]